jgi:ribosomal protein L17
MRHSFNRHLELETGVKKRSIFIRNLLTSLVKSGKVVTTVKRAKVLKAEADSFFAKLVQLASSEDQSYGRREAIRLIKATIYGEQEGKKLINELIPQLASTGKKT